MNPLGWIHAHEALWLTGWLSLCAGWFLGHTMASATAYRRQSKRLDDMRAELSRLQSEAQARRESLEQLSAKYFADLDEASRLRIGRRLGLVK